LPRYIVEIPETISEQRLIGVTTAENSSKAVRNIIFRQLPCRLARVIAARIRENRGYDSCAYLIPEVDVKGSHTPDEIRAARYWAFVNELGNGNPNDFQVRKAEGLWNKAFGNNF